MSLQVRETYFEPPDEYGEAMVAAIVVESCFERPAALSEVRIADNCRGREFEPTFAELVDGFFSQSAGSALDAEHDFPQLDRDEFVDSLVAAFRGHPHINNVLTHICGSQWSRISQALRAIVDPSATWSDLSALAQNLVELLWAELGVTGRILKPFLQELIVWNLPGRAADQLLCHIAGLCSSQATDWIYSKPRPADCDDHAVTRKRAADGQSCCNEECAPHQLTAGRTSRPPHGWRCHWT